MSDAASKRDRIDEILNVNRRWLPPSPHREAILEAIRRGQAHLESRGHNAAPVLVFSGDGGGGAIELPNVRYENTYRGMKLISSAEENVADRTRHPDVCGSVDEFKGLLRDQPGLAESDPHRLLLLIEDSVYMIRRMEKRREAYREFLAAVASACSSPVEGPDTEKAFRAAEQLCAFLKERPAEAVAEREHLAALAEEIRDVAGRQEQCLVAFRKLAVAIGKLYADIKGARPWDALEED